MSDRRAFLKFVAASPLIAAVPSVAEAFQQGGLEKAADALDVFDFQFAEMDEVRVTLRAERCWQQLGIPRRRTHQVASLRPWRPVRVLLNGRHSSTAGQYYSLVEYGLVLCVEPAPDEVGEARLVDLQADLL